MTERRTSSGKTEPRAHPVPMLLGLAVGSQLLVSYAYVAFMAPVVPLILAGVTAAVPPWRGFALGVLGAAVGGTIAFVIYGIMTAAHIKAA